MTGIETILIVIPEKKHKKNHATSELNVIIFTSSFSVMPRTEKA